MRVTVTFEVTDLELKFKELPPVDGFEAREPKCSSLELLTALFTDMLGTKLEVSDPNEEDALLGTVEFGEGLDISIGE